MTERKVFHLGEKAYFYKTISESDVYQFAGITGDFNRLQLDAEYAKRGLYGQRVVPGMLPASLLITCMGTQLPGNGAIFLDQSMKFVKPTFFGDTITAQLELIDYREKGEYYVLTLKGECRNQHGEVVVVGVCHAMIDRKEVQILAHVPMHDDEDDE